MRGRRQLGLERGGLEARQDVLGPALLLESAGLGRLEEEVQALREAPCSSCTEYKSTIQALHVELEIAAADNDRTRRERDDAMVELEKLRR